MYKFNILISSGGYGDAYFGDVAPAADQLSRLTAAGTVIPIDKFLTDELTPNIMDVFHANPKLKGILTSPDGKIYTLFRFTDVPQNYLESPMWINKEWLANVGKSVPTTQGELTDVLRAFKTGDPNKNGVQDEIPLIVFSLDPYAHFEALLGLYGIPTKDNTADNYVVVRNGQVMFAPTLPEYKEAIKYFSELYGEGLIWNEAFTATQETYTARINAQTASFGLITTKNVPVNVEQYECITPPKIEGYNPVWYYHPGSMGAKNIFSITDKCADPKLLMAYIDGFLSFENSVQIMYGMPGEGIIEQKDGMYKFAEPPQGKTQAEMINDLTAYMSFSPPSAILGSRFGTDVELPTTLASLLGAYNTYKPFINTEVWPRPYFSADSAARTAELSTDIFNTVTKYKASWISGQSSVEDEWGKFNDELKRMGLEEFVQLLQMNYDTYKNAIG